MVRLKVKDKNNVSCCSISFQFLDGAIKSDRFTSDVDFLIKFQFLDGAIKSQRIDFEISHLNISIP